MPAARCALRALADLSGLPSHSEPGHAGPRGRRRRRRRRRQPGGEEGEGLISATRRQFKDAAPPSPAPASVVLCGGPRRPLAALLGGPWRRPPLPLYRRIGPETKLSSQGRMPRPRWPARSPAGRPAPPRPAPRADGQLISGAPPTVMGPIYSISPRLETAASRSHGARLRQRWWLLIWPEIGIKPSKAINAATVLDFAGLPRLLVGAGPQPTTESG